jgi:hypothetical protein
MKVFCINRNDRPQRWNDVWDELIRVGIKPERFSAVVAKPGWIGCRDSHLKLFEQNKDREHLLIFEDDVKFLVDPVNAIAECFAELPPDWDCLYFGASPKEPQERYSEHLFRLKNAHTTHAILWNMKGDAVDYILDHKDDIKKIDDFFATVIQPMFKCFVVFPMVATQSDKHNSDTCKRSDVSTILKNFTEFCK